MFICSLLLLGPLLGSVSAELTGTLYKRSDISPRQTRECLISGWIPVCPGALPCIPPSGTCCTGGYYHLPGGSCPRGTVEVARIGQSAPVPSITPAPTPTPAPAPPIIQYTWYTYTITYYYYYYYYYYFAATYQLTSTRTTYFTTISLTATNEAAASSAIVSVTAAIPFVPPTQAATPTLGSTPVATSTKAPTSTLAQTSTQISTSIPVVIHSSSKAATSTGNTTLSTSATPSQFVGAAASIRPGGTSAFGAVHTYVIGSLLVAPALLMLYL